MESAVATMERLLHQAGIALVTAYLNHKSYIDIAYQNGKPYLKACQMKPMRVTEFRLSAAAVAGFGSQLAKRGINFTIKLAEDQIANDASGYWIA